MNEYDCHASLLGSGDDPLQTTTPACFLTLRKAGRIRIVTGRWHDAGVSQWRWGRWTPTTIPFDANVRLLSGGRLAKLYQH
jgi:hypothetical protein